MSLFVQGYAFRIASLAIGGWLLGDAVIDVAPASTSIALGRDRPNAVHAATTAAAVARRRPARAPDRRPSRLLVETAHRACRVGEALLWGNVGASCAASFAAFVDPLPDRRAEILDARRSVLRCRARPELGRSGRVVSDRFALGVGAQRVLPLVPDRHRVQVRGLLAVDGRRARSRATRRWPTRTRHHDPVRLERRHRAARAALGRRRPPRTTSARSGGSIPTASTASRRSTASTSSSFVCSAASTRGSDGFDAPRGRVRGARRVPLVAAGGEVDPDAELLGRVDRARRRRGAGPRAISPPAVPRTSANLLRFLSDTLLLTGVGFDPPAPDPGRRGLGRRRARPRRRGASTRPSAGRRRLLPRPPRRREHDVRRRPVRRARGRRADALADLDLLAAPRRGR